MQRRDRPLANRYKAIPHPWRYTKENKNRTNPLSLHLAKGVDYYAMLIAKQGREQWRLHTNRRHPRKANGLKALLKCPYYQSEFRVDVISTRKALVFFTKQKKKDGNGVTRLLFQHLGTGNRRISSSNTALATHCI